ncbi:methyltransferase domain-containing protein [Anaerobiospirillum sp. NML120449]|uniref:class I SAM-dependent methyltransferase n=1 Tax=Anaerobiospirillum sp. NML120449 TaxID=2932817 RepID=UPI001FF48139|nr:methyltransferase domain-containing protein [Anaerobiospirillum sp. NML120449]MCK0526414.1 class I SAM-dependent methyltransferase [Anaerobiospirillum sp. NML120449]
MSTASDSFITYTSQECCPVCQSRNYSIGSEHKEIIQALPMKAEEISQQAVLRFTPVLCENCGISFNLKSIDAQSRATINRNYQFIKATSMGAANYQTYMNEVKKHLKSKSDKILEIGGYDGYLLRELASDGYTDLTLIDPSSKTDDLDDSLKSIKVVNGFFPEHDPVFTARNGGGSSGLYDVVCAKDVLQMIPDPLGFMKAINAVIKKGGMLVLTSVPLHVMHALQCNHLGINVYSYFAQHSGFQLLEHYKKPENGYIVYVLRKETDLIDEPELSADFAAQPQRSPEDFAAEQERNRELIKNSHSFSDKASAFLNERISHYSQSDSEIVIYGTGFYTFNIIDAVTTDLSRLNLTLVNSSAEQDGYLFMLPDSSTCPVHYAMEYLKGRHIPLLILGVQSPLFKNEIADTLQKIGCTFDELLYLPDHE